MNATPLCEAEDALDGLLSDFFKSELKKPWPAAPATPASHSQPAVPPSPRDTGRRARYTLAASVALLLGTCWTLSNGFQPADRPIANPGNGNGLNMNSLGASNPDPLLELRKDAALKGNTNNDAFDPTKVDPFK